MSWVSFTIPGSPVPKARPRVGIHAGTGRAVVYSDKKTENFENLVALHARKAMSWGEPFEGPLKVTVAVYVTPPVSFDKNARRYRTCQAGVIWPAVKPDVDNFIKAAFDGMNRIIFLDDAQIVSVTATKHYDTIPRMEIKVEHL